MANSEFIQSLESRRLFAIPVSGGVATISGTGNADVLEVIANGSLLQVRNASGAVINSANLSGITKIIINAGGGNDFVRMGRGDGTLTPNIPATISGNAGNDTLIGGLKNDQILGNEGEDRLDGRAGSDLIDGGAGFDTADYSYRTVPVKLTLGDTVANDGSSTGNNAAPATANDAGGDKLLNIEAAVGGNANDALTGSPAANWLDGGGGNDTIIGGPGIDTIIGGVKNDLAYGDGDDDTFLMKDAAADLFLGTPGVTYAQYDAGIDSPAPAVVAKQAMARALASAAADGTLDLDTTFGPEQNGKQIVSVGGGSITINDVTLQPDGKIIAVGGISYSSEAPSDFVVMRFNANGTLDTSFGPDRSGIVYTDFSVPDSYDSNDYANSVTVDSQGRIAVAGEASYFQFFPDESSAYVSPFAVARYTADGTLDSTFGDGGLVRLDPNNTPTYDSAARIYDQRTTVDGVVVDNYLVAGTLGQYFGPTPAFTGTDSDNFGMIRLDEAGAMDTTFGGSGLLGLVEDDFGGDATTSDRLTGLDVDQSTGNIWLSGTADGGIAVSGYDSNGFALSYGRNVYYEFESSVQSADASVSNGELVIVGSLGGDGYSTGFIAAVSIEPPVVTAAATSALLPGEILTAEVTEPNARQIFLNSVTKDKDGNGVAVGTIDGNQYVYRFNFSDLSVVGTPQQFSYGESSDQGSGVVVQPDGKYLVVGQSFLGSGNNGVTLTRFNAAASDVWVDVNLDTNDIQEPGAFTYVDENGQTKPVPTYLVWRYTKLNDDGTWTIEGTDLGETFQVYEKDGVITVTRDGEFWQETSGTVTKIIINAGGGNDTVLVDSGFSIPVKVNGGTGNDSIRGGNAADELNGEDGNDMLIGQGGNDTLRGGKGRDMLFGGAGKDYLYGDAGEDALIAGATKWEQNPQIMNLFASEWNRSDKTYTQRVNNLVNGGGYNTTFVLNKSTTISIRTIADVLMGGTDQDAFWGNFRIPGDVLSDRLANETVTSNS